MPFALPEYDQAFARFVADSLRELARARDPLLERIQFQPATTLGSRIQDREGVDVELAPVETSQEMTTPVAAVRDGDISAFVADIDRAAGEYAEQLARHLFGTLDKVTEATGNVFNAEGRSFF